MYDNNLRQFKVILYRLKRNFGKQVVFRYPTTNTYNVTTGDTTRTFAEITVRRCIVLPVRSIRDFTYDLSFIASNKNFTYGGFYDTFTRRMIVEKKDINNLDVELNWQVTYKNKIYVVKESDETEDGTAYTLICKALDEETP